MPIFQLPRGPIMPSNSKSGRLDEPDGYKKQMLAWRDAARDQAMNNLQMNLEWAEIPKYIDFLEGRHWNRDRPKYRSNFFDNRIAEARVELLSSLTDIKPTVDVYSRVPDYEHQAEIAKMVIQHEWIKNRMDLSLIAAVDHALFGVGYWKIGAFMPGAMSVMPVGMDVVIPFDPGLKIQDSSGVLYKTVKSISYYRRIWGSKADGLEKEANPSSWTNQSNQYVRPGWVTEYTWNAMSPAMRYALGSRVLRQMPPTGSDSFPTVNLEEYWVDDPSINESRNEVVVRDPDKSLEEHNYWSRIKPGKRLFPRKRLIVFAGDRLMYDGPSMFWHGLYPFAQLILNPIVWGPGGMAEYRTLMPLNRAINEVGAGTLDVVKRAINPQVISKEGAVRDGTWQKFFPDMPGGKLRLTSISQVGQDVKYMDPPILPSYVFQFLESYLLQAFDRRTGRIDVTTLGKKAQIPGGDTIEQMRDTMQTAFRIKMRYIENFLTDSGAQAISNIFQFYTLKQRMKILGADGITLQDFDFDPETMVPYQTPKEDHWRNFAMEIAPGSLHGGAKDRNKQISMSLFRLGAISRKQLLRTLEIGNIDQIESEIAEERSAGLMPDATGKGEVPRLTRGARVGGF